MPYAIVLYAMRQSRPPAFTTCARNPRRHAYHHARKATQWQQRGLCAGAKVRHQYEQGQGAICCRRYRHYLRLAL